MLFVVDKGTLGQWSTFSCAKYLIERIRNAYSGENCEIPHEPFDCVFEEC